MIRKRKEKTKNKNKKEPNEMRNRKVRMKILRQTYVQTSHKTNFRFVEVTLNYLGGTMVIRNGGCQASFGFLLALV